MAEDVAKLPKWAQNEIRRLEGDLKYTQDQLRQMNEGDTDVKWSTELFEWNGLPRHTNIMFTFPNGKEVTVSMCDGVLRVDTENIVVSPGASNVVFIRSERFRE